MARRMSKKLLILFVVTLLTAFSGISISQAKELKWVGCGITKKAFMKELAEAYRRKTGTKIIIKGGGATKGIRFVAKGVSDLGGSCRHKIDVPEEKGVKMVQVAWDAIVVVVNKNNPVDNVSSEQLKDILTGKIKNWKALGGPDAPINLYIRKGKISGVGLMARELIFHNPDQKFSGSAKKMRSSGPLERAISRDKYGIGLTGISSAKKRKRLKILKIDGVYPSKENIMSGRYPYYRPLYLVVSEKPSKEVKRFIEFALSPEGQSVISKQGTINLEEGKLLNN